MRGRPVKTPERVHLAQQMRAAGFLLREIGPHFGVSPKTASAWISDPDLTKQSERRARYARPCPDCGQPMDGSDGPSAGPASCLSCTRQNNHASARARVIEAMHEWNRRFGRPPMAADWNQGMATSGNYPASRARRAAATDYDWPPVTAVQRLFGSWNAGVEAAGFEPLTTRRPKVAA